MAKRRYGQHFLEPAWVTRLIDVVAPAPDDRFLEIGPGHGALTLPLAARAAKVVAVEVDRDLVLGLRPRLPDNASLVQGDVLRLDLAELVRSRLEAPIRVAANLPYNIAAPILFRLVALADGGRVVRDATLMIQREVANRVVAEPGSGDYGVLSVLLQQQADASRLLTLPPGAFRPAPKVQSAVIRLAFRPPRVPVVDPAGFEALVRGIFAYRRKTLARAIGCWRPDLAPGAARLARLAGIDPGLRPEALHLADLARLADFLARPPVDDLAASKPPPVL